MNRLGFRHKTGLVAVALLAFLAQPAALTQAPASLGVQTDDQPSTECSLPADATTPSDVDADAVKDAVDETVEDAEERVCEVRDEADELTENARESLSDTGDLAG